MNKRRKVVVTLGTSLLQLPLTAFAQQPKKPYRIGILAADSVATRAPNIESFVAAMHGLGYVEGENVLYEKRFADGDSARLAALAAEIASLKLDVVVVPNDRVLQAAARATEQAKHLIPIVFAGSASPLGDGRVASLARPSGYVTGVTNFTHEVAGKQLQLLKDSFPKISRLAMFLDVENGRLGPVYLEMVERAGKELNMQTLRLEVKGGDDVERNVGLLRAWKADSMFVANQPPNFFHRRSVVQIANIARLPAIYGNDVYTRIGGLISYGSNDNVRWRQIAKFVDKILRGARAGDLPIEIPTKFDLIINLKTARTLGLTFPRSILAQADLIIE